MQFILETLRPLLPDTALHVGSDFYSTYKHMITVNYFSPDPHDNCDIFIYTTLIFTECIKFKFKFDT